MRDSHRTRGHPKSRLEGPKCAQGPGTGEEVQRHDGTLQYSLWRKPLLEDEPALVDSEGHPLPEEALTSDRRLDSLFSIADDDDNGLASMDGVDGMDFEDDSREIEEQLASLTDRPVEAPAKKARSVPRFPSLRRHQNPLTSTTDEL